MNSYRSEEVLHIIYTMERMRAEGKDVREEIEKWNQSEDVKYLAQRAEWS